MNYDGKKLLILGGAGPHVKVVESAHEMGIQTIVADYLPDSPAKTIADVALMNNIYDIDELVQYGKENKIDGVLGFSLDPTQKPAHQIAADLGLPVFGDDFQVMSLTDKGYFKALCKKAGVDTIQEFSIDNLDEVEYPCLVKPGESRGSRGITVCENRSELESAIAFALESSSNGKCIIEKYMADNQDLTISYIVKDGKATLISLGDRYPGREEDNLNRQLTGTIQPSRYVDMYMKNVDQRIRHMICDVLGIQNGPVFFQGFVDGDTVRLYDPGIRFPGNEYERIYKIATGLDPMKSIISYCVGGEILDYDGKLEDSYDLNGMLCIQYMINLGPGVIGKFEGLDEISKAPFVVDVQQRHFVGETIENTGDIKHRAGEISVLVERDAEKLAEAVEFIQSKLVIEDVDGNNQIISPFDVDIIRRNYGGNHE